MWELPERRAEFQSPLGGYCKLNVISTLAVLLILQLLLLLQVHNLHEVSTQDGIGIGIGCWGCGTRVCWP